jgi:hypothetical protein
MDDLLNKLKGGTLISDGNADQVADEVLINPRLINFLMEGLKVQDNVVRARTAHALEKISRIHADWFSAHLTLLTMLAEDDPIPMVRWHLVMLLTNLTTDQNHDHTMDILLNSLEDNNAFVLSWAISGLCILSRRYPHRTTEILKSLRPLCNVHGTAIRTRASKAVQLLENPFLPIPKGWIKTK